MRICVGMLASVVGVVVGTLGVGAVFFFTHFPFFLTWPFLHVLAFLCFLAWVLACDPPVCPGLAVK